MRRFVLGLCGVLMACSGGEPPPQNPAQRGGGVNITIAQVEQRQLERRLDVLAEIEALEAPQVLSETTGRIIRLKADVGQQVRIGDILAEIDPDTLQNHQRSKSADVARLIAQKDNKTRELARFSELKQKGFVTPAYLDNLRAEVAALEHQLQAAQAQSANAGQDLARATVVAPIDGTIDVRAVSQGEYVTPGRLLFQLSSSKGLRARFALPDRESAAVVPGISVDLMPPNQAVLPVRITEIRPAIDKQSRMLEALATLPGITELRAGQSIPASVILERRQTLAVPALSVVQRQQGTVVFRIENGTAVEHAVRTGMRHNAWIEILEGVKIGDTIAVEGAGFLSHGAKVRTATDAPTQKTPTNPPKQK